MATTLDIKTALSRMQAKQTVRPVVWQNPNGTFPHCRDGKTEWMEESSCRTDLLLFKEWGV